MGSFGQDLAHGVRRLARRSLLTRVATATLAIGIGGAVAIFSVAHAVILRPLPYAEPERLVLVWQSDLRRGQPFVEMSYTTFRDWRARNTVFEDLAGLPSTNQSWTLRGRGEPVQLVGRLVSWNFFSVLGVPPALGRALLLEDDRRGAGRVVVLGHALWRDRFGADPRVVGSSVVLEREPFTVVGVMPEGFAHPAGAQLWTPLVPGVSELDPEQPAPEVVAMSDAVFAALGGPRFAARVFSAFALVALLLAGLGLYGLIAYSVGRRTREIGVRVALGARPHDVARLVLGEGLKVALPGLGLGLAASLAGARLLSSLLYGVGPTDALTLAAASALLIGIAALASALPARRALRVQPSVALRQE